MSDEARFEGLKKLPPGPAAAILKPANVKLETPLATAQTATVVEVLRDLDAQRDLAATAEVDMIKLLSQAMPRREAVWWSCLAARDIVGRERELSEGCLWAAESWVFKPGEETRRAAFEAMRSAPNDDDTVFCAMAAVYESGTYGPDELEAAEVAPGVFGHVVFGMVMTALEVAPEGLEIAFMGLQIDRALDIARGGNGKAVEMRVADPLPVA